MNTSIIISRPNCPSTDKMEVVKKIKLSTEERERAKKARQMLIVRKTLAKEYNKNKKAEEKKAKVEEKERAKKAKAEEKERAKVEKEEEKERAKKEKEEEKVRAKWAKKVEQLRAKEAKHAERAAAMVAMKKRKERIREIRKQNNHQVALTALLLLKHRKSDRYRYLREERRNIQVTARADRAARRYALREGEDNTLWVREDNGRWVRTERTEREETTHNRLREIETEMYELRRSGYLNRNLLEEESHDRQQRLYHERQQRRQQQQRQQHMERQYQPRQQAVNPTQELINQDYIDCSKKQSELIQPKPAVETDSCPICFEDMDSNMNKMILRCGHQFCGDCIISHMQCIGGLKCPLCREQYGVRIAGWKPPQKR